MLQKLMEYQNRVMDAKPSDYRGNQIAWEMNVLQWFLRIIEQDHIDIDVIRTLTSSLEKSKK